MYKKIKKIDVYSLKEGDWIVFDTKLIVIGKNKCIIKIIQNTRLLH